MSTGQSAVMLCGWGVKAGWLIAFVDELNVWVAGWHVDVTKNCVILVNTCHSERFRGTFTHEKVT